MSFEDSSPTAMSKEPTDIEKKNWVDENLTLGGRYFKFDLK